MTDTDMGKGSWAVKSMYNAGVEVRWRKGRSSKGAMHNKYVILDGKLLETGSFNWSVNGNVNSFENMIFVNDVQAIEAYQAMYDGFYSEATVPVSEDFEQD